MLDVRSACLVLATLVGAVGVAETARACEATPCSQVWEVTPTDDRIPLNTEIRVLYLGTLEASSRDLECGFDITQIRLVPRGGDVVELTGTLLPRGRPGSTWLVARPTQLLLPNTVYETQLQLSHESEVCGCEERQWTTVTTFTTASDVDEVAPIYSGVPALAYGDYLYEATPCGDLNHVPAWPGVEVEESAEWRYNVYVDGYLEKPYVQSLWGTPAAAELLVDCGTTQPHLASRLAPGKTFEVRAVDFAGNESSPNEPLLVADVCPTPGRFDGADVAGPSSDAAPTPTIDVSTASSDASLPASRGSSACALLLTGSGAVGGSLSAALLLLLACWRRRPVV